MASKSLHESSSLTGPTQEKVSNIHRQAQSHFTVKVGGGAKKYADSDVVKPHESHAHLNLSHVLIADEPEPEDASTSDIPEQASMSETVIHKGTTLVVSSGSDSDDEETITTQTDDSNPIMQFHKDDQGDGATKLPIPMTEDATGSASNSSLGTNSIHSDTAEIETASWSSISSIEDTLPSDNKPDDPPPAQEAPSAVEPESRGPARNIFALFRTGLMAARRNAISEPKEKPEDESDSSSGDDVDSISSAVQGKKSSEDVADKVGGSGKHSDLDAMDAEENGDLEASLKKESSATMQRLASGEIVDEIKEAMLVQGSSTAVVEGGKDESNQEGEDLVESAEVQPGDSMKSSNTTLSEFETIMQSDAEDLDAFVTAEALPDVTVDETDVTVDETVDAEVETENSEYNPQASYADIVKGGMAQQTEDKERQDIMQDQDKQKPVPPNESIQLRGFTKSDSSVEVIPDIKVATKETSSLDGLAIAEERESRESNQMQQEFDGDEETSEKLAHLQDELKSSQEENLKLRQQLDVQVMCEEYVRNEAKVEIEKAERKISRLQAQINKPLKLVYKHRKELRRIFDEIHFEGGPSNIGSSLDSLQHAIRHLYWKRKDMKMLLHETEQQLQLSQTESAAWKRRAKEQEAAKEQLMNDYEEQQVSKTKLIGRSTLSKSDTCLCFGDMKTVPSDIPSAAVWGLQDQCMSRQTLVDKTEHLKKENLKLRGQLLDFQNETQKRKMESTEVKSHADLLKSKLDVMNDELIQERLHSQHLLTKLHSHELTAKNSKLLGLVEKLEEVGEPVEEAVMTTTLLGDVIGLEDWLGHLKAGQQQIRTELDRYKDKVQVLQLSKAVQERNHQTPTDEQSAIEESEVTDQQVQATDMDTENKLWQELRQLRDVQLETVKDLEDKDGKISELQHRYSELLAEQLQQRTKLEMDMEDNRSEKQAIQDQLEETQQLVSELHRKCVQLSQALEEAQGILSNQDKTIQDLKDQFAVTMTTKQEEYMKRDENNVRQKEELERRLQQLEAESKGSALSEKSLRSQLGTVLEENRLLQKQNSKSSIVDDKLDIIHNELTEIREAEDQFRGKYNLQDKEIHHLHHHVNALQTGIKQQVQETINSALSGWQQERVLLETQLTKALAALDNSEQSRKATEDVNKILMKNSSGLEDSCKTLSQQLERQHMGHQKTVDKLQHMQSMLSEDDQTKMQMHQDHDDLTDWEHQLKEEAQRLSSQLHRIMGTHDTQVRAMREANAKLVNSLRMSPQTMHSYHDSVSSARAKLQVLLSSTRPKSAVPRLHHHDYMSGAPVPHRNPYTPAHGLTNNVEESRTMSGPFVRVQRPATMSSYPESSPYLSYTQGQH